MGAGAWCWTFGITKICCRDFCEKQKARRCINLKKLLQLLLVNIKKNLNMEDQEISIKEVLNIKLES